jgi:hypothetical protein
MVANIKRNLLTLSLRFELRERVSAARIELGMPQGVTSRYPGEVGVGGGMEADQQCNRFRVLAVSMLPTLLPRPQKIYQIEDDPKTLDTLKVAR